MPQSSRPLLILVFLLLTLIWGTTWSVIQIGLRGLPPFTGVAIRFAIAGIVILLWGKLRGIPLGRQPRERMLWWINGIFSFSISYGVVYWGEQWVPSGLASILFALYPLFVMLLAHFALPGERLRPLSSVGVVVGFLGPAVIFSEDFSLLGGRQVAIGAAAIVISPLAAALGTVAVKRWGAGIHPVSLTGVPMLFTGVLMGGIALLTERQRALSFDTASVLALLYLAIIGSAVTFSLYYWLLARVPATRAALLAYLIPVVAVSIGILFRGEVLTGRILLGSGLVLAGVALAVHSPHGSGAPPADEKVRRT